MADLKLYHYWRSSSSWRVRWTLAHKGCAYEAIAVNLLEGESEAPAHLARNPLGAVPVLETPAGFLTESMAIIHWIEETYPDGPSLLPRDPWARAQSRALAELINADTQPLQNLGVSAMASSDPDAQKRWNQHWTRRGLAAYETMLSRTAGRFSVGDELSLADVFLIPQCYNADRQDVSLQVFPTILRIREAAQSTSSGLFSHPDRFKPEGFQG